MTKFSKASLLAGASLLAAVGAAGAQEIDEVTLSVVGSWSSLPLYQQFEQPFWTEHLPQASDGRITVEMTTFNQLGSSGSDVYRLLADGVFDVGMTVADYTVADAPELEGLDVPLIATDAETARAAVDAARPMVEDIMRDRFNAKLLAIAPYPPQVVFCRDEIASLSDLEGRKVRGSGRMTTQFLQALGAEGINLAFSEVPGALERGIVDCAITGAGSGLNAGWWESANYLLTLPLGGWDPVVTAMNRDRWESLSPETQAFLQAQISEHFEAPAWADAQGALERDVACLTGGACASDTEAAMTLVEASDEDRQTAMAALQETVLPDWAERAGTDWAQRWNQSVGQATGVEIPLD
ncbi:TRAP transporter substrate-binding protein [Salinarimonas rosea]|uniref:TRAP transporter substrate-binding protein n=1 Tax=Salinarimonas rosea TaxID=552063 RepID=UPI000412A283|nr:TRAP transporter substrate-binding protein [Salinarimonas rosea]